MVSDANAENVWKGVATMTRAEAVKCLIYIKQRAMLPNFVDSVEAIDMAIEALSKPNYETDTEVRLAVTDRNKDKVVLWDAFGEVEYYPNGEINCVHCPHYHETEDNTGVHGHCGSHGRLIDAGFEEQHYASMLLNPTPDVTAKDRENAKIILGALKMAKTVQADRPHGEWVFRTDIPIGGGRESAGFVCTNCGKDYFQKEGLHFCPNCGADMRKGEE